MGDGVWTGSIVYLHLTYLVLNLLYLNLECCSKTPVLSAWSSDCVAVSKSVETLGRGACLKGVGREKKDFEGFTCSDFKIAFYFLVHGMCFHCRG